MAGIIVRRWFYLRRWTQRASEKGLTERLRDGDACPPSNVIVWFARGVWPESVNFEWNECS